MKEALFEVIDRLGGELTALSDDIFDHPEVGYEEYRASGLLCDLLEREGFAVERGIAGIPTAFRAVYENGVDGPSMGLLCEYDALPQGHACGHQMQGPAIVGAAFALKELLKEAPYKLIVYGTPAEEGKGGKVTMLEEGYLQDMDVALMMHGGPATQTDIHSMAKVSAKVTFHGKSAHAALKPEAGRSALDALLLSFQGVEFLREHVKEDTRIHYTVTDAGGPCNVVPQTASGEFGIRSYDSAYLDELIRRFENIVKGAALMTETTGEIRYGKRIEGKIPVLKLNELLVENAAYYQAPNLQPDREKTGSTDFANVMYRIPGACIRVAFVAPGTSSHSQEYVDAGKSGEAHNAVLCGAKILAATAADLVMRPELLAKVREEFRSKKM